MKLITFEEAELKKQYDCDVILSNLPCKERVVKYFFESREHARQQKKELNDSSFFSVVQTIENMKKENEKILNELYHITRNKNSFEICKRLETFKLLKKE
jgi:hypothetical protein